MPEAAHYVRFALTEDETEQLLDLLQDASNEAVVLKIRARLLSHKSKRAAKAAAGNPFSSKRGRS